MTGQPPPPAGGSPEGVALSAGQRATWQACRTAGREFAVRGLAYRVRQTDPAVLAARLTELCERHPVLRARLSADQQRWIPGRTPALLVEQPPVPSHDERAAAVRRRILKRPIDPWRGPLLRVSLARYPDGVIELLLVAHVAAFDGGALRRLAAELADLPRSEAVTVHGVVATGTPVESIEWGRFGQAPLPVGTATCTAAVTGATDLDALVAAVAVTLRRYTGQLEPVVAVAAGQDGFGAEPPVAYAVPVADGMTGQALRRRAHARRWGTDAPNSVEPDAPVPPVVVAVGGPPPLEEMADLQLAAIELRADAERVTCRYRTDVVERPAAQAFLGAVTAALHHFAVAGEQPVGGIRIAVPPLDPPVRLDVGADATIHGAVTRWAEVTPDAVAVVHGGEHLTYGELDTAADSVAARLRACGVRRGHRVGVAVEPSTHLVVALLGVLKAGAAYVPLDPAYPQSRLDFMSSDAQLTAVVLGPGVDRTFRELPAVRLPSAEPLAGRPRNDEPVGAADDAYIIYTSGSTGTPKGVVVPHGNVISLLAATRGFGFGRDDVWTLFHSYAFDFSVWEMWGCLASGGRLVVVPRAVARDPQAFHRLLVTERVTILNQTPSAFAQLLAVDAEQAADLDVRLLIFGGEPLDARMLVPWFGRYPETRCRVVNMYGITETTVHCTWQTVTRSDALSGSRFVGVALPGWSVHVLDGNGRPLPVGVPGEICVAGAGVSRGYLRRPGLTARRFVPDAVTGAAGGRLYRSGDRGRQLPDGRLEYLGRLDDQVKIRGHRIELGEIRAALLADPTVIAAAVVKRHHADAVYLDAYVTGSAADPARLRETLAAELPEYLVPSTITVVHELPTTVNGKLDVARLPAPGSRRTAAADASGQGTGQLLTLTRLWEEILGVTVLPDDNLFLVGGNSLAVHKIVIAIRRAGLGPVAVRDVYRYPTPRQLAGRLATARADR